MRTITEQFLFLKNKGDTSLVYWSSILHLIHQYPDNLSIEVVSKICDESERLRNYWNARGLGINKEDVYPNVYRCLRDLEYEEMLAEQEEKREEETKTYMTTELPLAAKGA